MAEEKVAKRKNSLETEEIEVSPCSGRRIVKLIELGRNLKYFRCHEVILLQNITDEHMKGLNSLLRRFNFKYGSKITHKFSCYFLSFVR